MAEQHEAFCVKCKLKVQMASHDHVTMKNGKAAVRGICPTCGTKVFRIGG